MTNQRLYDGLPRISTIIHNCHLALVGCVLRLDEMAREVLLWQPDVIYRIGLPSLTIKIIIEEGVGLHSAPRVFTVIHNCRLALAGHVMRLDEMAREVLSWQSDVNYRISLPSLTIKIIIEENAGLHGLPKVSTIIHNCHLALAGHAMRHGEMA